MKKKFFAFLLALVLATFCLPFLGCKKPEELYNDTTKLEMVLWQNQGYRVASIGEETSTDISIPATYKGLPVFQIGPEAFSVNNDKNNDVRITSIVIPQSVTFIGQYAFEGSALVDVTIPRSVLEIHDRAFCGIDTLEALRFEKTDEWKWLPSGDKATKNAELITRPFTDPAETAYLMSTVDEEWITGNYWVNGGYIEKATEDRFIEPATYAGIWLVKNVSSFGGGNSSSNSGSPNGSEVVGSDLEYALSGIGETAFYVVKSLGNETDTDIVIPSTYNGKLVKHIDDEAFSVDNPANNGVRITSISLPNSITYIGRNAFYGANLTQLVLPSSLYIIKPGAFLGNPLTAVTFTSNSKWDSSNWQYRIDQAGARRAGGITYAISDPQIAAQLLIASDPDWISKEDSGLPTGYGNFLLNVDAASVTED